MRKFLLSLLSVATGLLATAGTYTHTFTKAIDKAGGETELTGILWNASAADYVGYDAAKGFQMGSSKKPITTYTLTTSAFAESTITGVTVEMSVASNGNASVAVSVADVQFGDTTINSTTNVACSLNGSAKGELNITFTNNTTNKAVYCKSITVNYEGGGSVTPDPEPQPELVGQGTEEAPYTVGDVKILNNPKTKSWVTGYIVGYVSSSYSFVFSAADASNTNLLIAATATETDSAKCIPVQLPSGDVRTALNLKDNADNLGKKVDLYGSLEAYFSQPAVKSVTKYVLEGGVEPPTPPVVETEGKGTEEAPYTVGDVKILDNPKTQSWVTGYIVGFVNSNNKNSFEFTTENAVNTNLLIAATATETDSAKCIPVQLPSGDVRTALNLKDNADNLGKKVDLYGSLEAYFSQPAVKSVTKYVLEGGVEPPTPPVVETEGKGTEEAPYTVGDVKILDNPKTQSWVTGYIVGFVNSNNKNSFDFTTENAVNTNLLIAATATETDSAKCIPVQLPSGDVRTALNLKDNADNLGKKVDLYGSLEAYFSQPAVKSVTKYVLEGGVEPPTPPVVETEGKGTEEAPYTVGDVKILDNPKTQSWVTGYIVGFVNSNNKNSFDFTTENAVNTNLLIAATATETDSAKCIPVQLPSGDVRTALNLKDNAGNLGKKVDLYGSLEAYFSQPAVKSVTKYVLEGGVEPPTPPVVETEGEGTDAAPYTVADVLKLNNPNTKAWAKGYIVGYVKGMSISTAVFEASDSVMTNILLAPTAAETTIENCIPVQLPAGEVRSALNLKDNPGNLGKEVSVYGTLTAYFGVNAVKSVTEYKIAGAVAPVYGEVADIEEWLAEQPEDYTTITSEVTVVYQNNLDLFIQDETGSLLVYGNLGGRTFKNGDRISGITGKYSAYQNMVQCSPVASSLDNVTEGDPVEPAKATLSDVNGNNLAKYVTISDLTVKAEDNNGTTVYYVTDGINTIEIYNRYKIEGIAAGSDATLTGFVYVYGDKMELVPIEFSVDTTGINEIVLDADTTVIYDLQGRRVTNAGPGLYIVNGHKVLVK